MQLKIPVCLFDAKTGILCASCESKLRAGLVSRTDVEVSKALAEVAESLRGAATLVRSFRVDGNYVLELDSSGVAAFRNNREALAGLESRLGGRVWMTVAATSNRQFVEDLLHPTKVLALDTLWLPDGSKVAKAILAGRINARTHPPALISKMAKETRGIDLVVESRDQNRPIEIAARTY